MSRENVELVRRASERINRGGEPDWSAFAREVEFKTRPDGPMQSSFRGIDDVRRGWRQTFREIWGGMTIEPREFIAGEGRVVAVWLIHLRAHGSGVELDVEEAWAYWLRDGRIRRVEQYGSKAEAVIAAGLSE